MILDLDLDEEGPAVVDLRALGFLMVEVLEGAMVADSNQENSFCGDLVKKRGGGGGRGYGQALQFGRDITFFLSRTCRRSSGAVSVKSTSPLDGFGEELHGTRLRRDP